jgi:DNA polymerase-3 subunit alpha
VKLGGIVTAVKEISTKNGERMAFVTLEDLAGSVETVVFPDLYRSSMLHLAKDSAVLVKGQVDIGEETVKLLLSEVQPLSLAANGGPSLVEVTLAGRAASLEGFQRLKEILEAHRGSAPLRLHIHLPEGGQVTIAPASSLTVMSDDRLRQALEAEFGAECLRLG